MRDIIEIKGRNVEDLTDRVYAMLRSVMQEKFNGKMITVVSVARDLWKGMDQPFPEGVLHPHTESFGFTAEHYLSIKGHLAGPAHIYLVDVPISESDIQTLRDAYEPCLEENGVLLYTVLTDR